MTRTNNRTQWVRIHSRRAAGLYSVYQCKADPDQWDRLDKAIKGVIVVIKEIADRKESEGDWAFPCESCPNKACVDPCPELIKWREDHE